MTWSKVDKSKSFGRATRKMCAVSSSKSGVRKAIFPCGILSEGSYDIFVDGYRVAFRPATSGGYKVSRANKMAQATNCTMPAAVKAFIPHGTHDVPHSKEDGMLVLDLTGIQQIKGGDV